MSTKQSNRWSNTTISESNYSSNNLISIQFTVISGNRTQNRNPILKRKVVSNPIKTERMIGIVIKINRSQRQKDSKHPINSAKMVKTGKNNFLLVRILDSKQKSIHFSLNDDINYF